MTLYAAHMPEVLFIQSRPTDPRLKRNVKHDPDSRKFPYQPKRTGVAPVSIRHTRHVPIFDQGQIGDCTANAQQGCLGTGPLYAPIQALAAAAQPTFTQGSYKTANSILGVYHSETSEDDYQGTYPPDDTGSDGLTAAKVAKERGWISGYTHNLQGTDLAVQILQETPFITGINWYNNMFNPDAHGVVSISDGDTVAGGHEICVDEWNADLGLFGFSNSWGTSWGVSGRFYMSVPTYARLLSENGDGTVFSPLTAPAPTPINDPDLAALVSSTAHWIASASAYTGAAAAKRGVETFLAAKGVS